MKGRLTQGALLAFILLAVAILVLTSFGSQLFAAGKKYVDEGTCEENIQKSINARLGGLSAPVALNCPTYRADFADKPAEIVAQVSDALTACWKRWHEGESEIFDAKTEVYCDICSVFFPDEDSVTMVGFRHELERRLMPITGIPVATYVQSTTQLTKSGQQKADASLPDEFTTDKEYAVVFRYVRAVNIGVSFDWVAELQFVPHTGADLRALGCTTLPVGQTLPPG